ncbi:MAG: 4-hydroxythreonine-4-phosphate dehydrogenase PdxA [Phycisphaerales bacterium]
MAPSIAISTGDPLGIGPEVLLKALAAPLPSPTRILLYGHVAPFTRAARETSHPLSWRVLAAEEPVPEDTGVYLIDHPAIPLPDLSTHEDNPLAGAASFECLDRAINACLPSNANAPLADALVTAPISKRAWAMAGHARWPGHTELLAHRLGADRVAMLFDSPRLRVALVTHHIPLLSLAEHLTREAILDAIRLAHEYVLALGVDAPRVAVCGLNPHAGEQGLLGHEEQDIITPAIDAARQQGIDARGPFPADTVFLGALEGRSDIVVAMYHDQGLIPVKTIARDEAVNVTAGLPVPRTSPDHGVAYDIAGKNRANPSSMRRAIELAVTLANRRANKSGAPGSVVKADPAR